MIKYLKIVFIITDVGFVLYWIVSGFKLIPEMYLFKDYSNPLTVAWNWSFFPLDILISITGFSSLYLNKVGNILWKQIALVSLVLTFCSGLQAISFWWIRLDFDISWWLPNLYLLIYPLIFIPYLLREEMV
jgi:hypothetical protein